MILQHRASSQGKLQFNRISRWNGDYDWIRFCFVGVLLKKCCPVVQSKKWGRATLLLDVSQLQRSMSRWCSANKKGGKISRHSRCGHPSIENGGHFSSVSSCPVSSTTSVALFCVTYIHYWRIQLQSSVQNQNQKRKSRTWEIYSEALFSTRQQQLLNFKVWSVEYSNHRKSRNDRHLENAIKLDCNWAHLDRKTCQLTTLKYLIIVQHLSNINSGKLRFIWLGKKDNLMLLNW